MDNNENIGVETQNTQNTQTSEKDYKLEYEKQLMEIEKLKNAISKTNSENAEYKRQELERKKKELESLPEIEKLREENKAIVESNSKMEAKIKEMELEKELVFNGFSATEIEKLVKGKFAVKDIAEIIKSRVDEAVKSAKAEMTKGSTSKSLLGNGSSDTDTKSDFQKRQESRQKDTNIVKL